MELLNSIPSLAMYIVIALFFFILVREIICWYFKINERVAFQKEVLAELVKLNLSTKCGIDTGLGFDRSECANNLKIRAKQNTTRTTNAQNRIDDFNKN